MTDKIILEDMDNFIVRLKSFEQKISGKHFLITGGSGFIGSWFCDTLVRLNANVLCVDNLSSGTNENIKHLSEYDNFSFISSDICDFETNEKFDYIVHMASIASPLSYMKFPIETLDANVVGTKKMLELAIKNNVESFLFTSTSEVYGNPPDEAIPTPETYYGYTNSYGPRAVYDEGKRCAEAYCYAFFNRFKLPIRIARIFNTFGPRLDIKNTTQYGRVIVKFIHQAISDSPLTVYGNGNQTRSFCYITDQLFGLFSLLLTPNLDGEIFNIGNEHEITILDLATKIKKMTNSKSEIAFQNMPKDDPRRRRPDLSKAKKLLNYSPKTSLEEGLSKTITWTKSH